MFLYAFTLSSRHANLAAAAAASKMTDPHHFSAFPVSSFIKIGEQFFLAILKIPPNCIAAEVCNLNHAR